MRCSEDMNRLGRARGVGGCLREVDTILDLLEMASEPEHIYAILIHNFDPLVPPLSLFVMFDAVVSDVQQSLKESIAWFMGRM